MDRFRGWCPACGGRVGGVKSSCRCAGRGRRLLALAVADSREDRILDAFNRSRREPSLDDRLAAGFEMMGD